MTNDLARRFDAHKKKSAKFTSYNPPVKVLYTEGCASRSEALKREAAIKKLKRPAKLALIKSR